MDNDPTLYGLLAKFDNPEDLVRASNRTVEAGYKKFDTYTPYPVEGLARAMRLKPSPLPLLILAGGVLGAIGGFLMQAFATVLDNPYNIGGRPLFSWPAYIPIAFEVTVLSAAVFGFLGLFVMNRLPQPYHPVFNSEDFNEHATQDGFYLDIEANDPKFDIDSTRKFLEDLGSIQVSEIEA